MGTSKAGLLLLGMLTASAALSACGNDNAANEPAAPAASNGEAKNGPAGNSGSGNDASAAAEPFGKYAEPVTVTEVLGYNPPEDPKTPAGIYCSTRTRI